MGTVWTTRPSSWRLLSWCVRISLALRQRTNTSPSRHIPAPPGYNVEPRRYPELAPILAGDLKPPPFDVRFKPRDSIPADVFRAHRYMYALARPAPVRHVRLVSPEFPWSIEIRVGAGQVVTVETVWDALHRALQEPLVDSEWGMIVLDDNHLERMEFAARRRLDKEGAGAARFKRVDWLGDGVLFKGLVRDEGFERKRLLPGAEKCAETWVVKLGVL
jgi:hypothetical protein